MIQKISILSQSLSPQLPRPAEGRLEEKTGAGKENFPGKEDERRASDIH